eukprot:6184292-Pleurochrysis_carterae.AAC.2
MSATRLCLDAVPTWDEMETSSHDGPNVDGRSAYLFARQNGGDFTLRDCHLTLARYACLPFSAV